MKLRIKESYVTYWCQGCKSSHTIAVGSGDGPQWTFNGNPQAPTFSPSVLVKSGHYCSGYKQGDPCWCTYNAEHPDEPSSFSCEICHTFVKDGMVQFLSDCTHEFAGQIVPLPELPAHFQC